MNFREQIQLLKDEEINLDSSKESSSSPEVLYKRTISTYEETSKESWFKKSYEETLYKEFMPTFKNILELYEEVKKTYEKSSGETSKDLGKASSKRS